MIPNADSMPQANVSTMREDHFDDLCFDESNSERRGFGTFS